MATNSVTAIDDRTVVIPAGITDLHCFRDWAHSDDFPEYGRVSYLRGEILVDLSPEEVESHNKPLSEVARVIGNVVKERDLGEVLIERVLFVNAEADIATEPDLLFCSWEALRDGRAAYREHVAGSRRYVEVFGTPDLIVEVVSRSSLKKDSQLLFERYFGFGAGVREYWLIDARANEIDFRIHRRGRSRFQKIRADAGGFVRSEVLDRAFRLSRSRNPIGGWRYDFEMR